MMHQFPHWGMPTMYMEYYENQQRLISMYPDVYRSLYPRVQEICHHYDVPSNPRMYPNIEAGMIEDMVGQLYETEIRNQYAQQFRGVFRDLITILVIRELLGRRRRRFYPTPPAPGPWLPWF